MLDDDAIERRIGELFDLGLDGRTEAEQEELEELLHLAPCRLDPDPIVFDTPYGRQDANGVDVTLIEEQLKLSVEDRLRVGRRHARRAEGFRLAGVGGRLDAA